MGHYGALDMLAGPQQVVQSRSHELSRHAAAHLILLYDGADR